MTNETPWMDTAKSYIGLKEIVGTENAKDIISFFAETGNSWIKDDETAWCAAFAGTVLKRNGFKIPSGVAAVRAAEYNSNIGTRLDTPKYGAIVQMNYGQKGVIDHVTFFYEKVDDDHFMGLGGNQSNQVKLSSFKTSDIAGIWWPEPTTVAPVPVPRPQPVEISNVSFWVQLWALIKSLFGSK